jgi:hypothetical protein
MKGSWTIVTTNKITPIFAKVTMISVLNWFVRRWDRFLVFLNAFLFFRSGLRLIIFTRLSILFWLLVWIVNLARYEWTQIWGCYLILWLFIFIFPFFCLSILHFICLLFFILIWRNWWYFMKILLSFIDVFHINISILIIFLVYFAFHF